MRLLVIISLLGLICSGAEAASYTIAKGNVAKAAIVIARNATEPMKVGASEIQKHVELMGGARLPIIEVPNIADFPAPVGYAGVIVISNSEIDKNSGRPISFKTEEYTIRTEPGKPFQIRISGDGQRGAIYGCYAFLEDVLGVRWFTPAITKVPTKKTVAVKELWIRQKPDFEYREPFFEEAFDKMWAVRNKTNGNTQRLDDSVGGKIAYGRFVHTFDELVPQSYYEAHPEYFSMINGRRMPGYAQLCLTNPDVLKISIQKVRSWLENDKKSVLFSVSQNDAGYPCECDQCKAVVEEEGAQSGVILKFVNAIAADIAKDYPDVLIDTLAYQYSEAPPKHIKPLPNVRIRLAPISNCFGHTMGTCEANIKPYQNLVEWGKITNQLYIWHYSTNFAHYLMPLPCVDEIASSIPIYKKNGAVGLFYQGSYQSLGGALAELKSYLCAKLMWDSKRNAKRVIDDYMRGVYGKGAPAMKQWLDLIHSEIRKSKDNHAFIYDGPTNPYMTDKVVETSFVLFDKASKAAADNPIALREIEKARMWMRYVALTQSKIKYEVVGDQYKAVGDEVDERMKAAFTANLRDFKVTHIREGGPNVDSFLNTLGRTSTFKVYNLENDQVKVSVVPEVGGRIVQATFKKNNANIFKETAGVLNLASGGYEEYFNHDYRGPGYSEVYAVDSSQTNANAVVMTLDLFNPIKISRKIELQGNKIIVATSATNNGASDYKMKMRSHPELNMPDTNATISFVDLNGKTNTVKFESGEQNKFYVAGNRPNGSWTADLGSYSVTNTFDLNKVSQVLLNGTTVGKRFNFELYSNEMNVAPGQTVTFGNAFEINAK